MLIHPLDFEGNRVHMKLPGVRNDVCEYKTDS